MKPLFSLLLLLFSVSLSAQFSDLNFLEGTWKVTDKPVYEEWVKVDRKNFKGQAYKLKGGVKEAAESLAITKDGRRITYFATVLNQNAAKTIPFKLNRLDERTFSFENLKHDFPKKIIYQRISDTELRVRVQGDSPKEAFEFTMVKESTTN